MSTSYEFLQYFPDFTWNFTPEILDQRSMNLISDIKTRIDGLTWLSRDYINFQSVCDTLADMEGEMQREKSIIEVYFITSPVCQVRDKCLELIKMWSEFFAEISMRRDIYDLLIKVQSVETSLPYESARYLEKSILYKKRDGVHLEVDVRDKLTTLLKKISSLCIDFNKNISDLDIKIEFDKKELLGMSDDFFLALPECDGKYTVSLTSSHAIPILKQCHIQNTRKIIEKAYNSRCIETNVPILTEILQLRNERAKLLGYKTHVDYVTEIMMSRSADSVSDFLKIMFNKIQNASKREMKRLLELKRKQCREMGVEFDGKINPYDCSYYENMVVEEDYKIDKNLIKAYFQFEDVTRQLFDIYQRVLCLTFEQVENPSVIHHDVSLYAVYDKESHSLMGYFYMDLFPRPFKYRNVACFGLQAASHYKNIPQLACAVLIANFPKPYPEKPSLLSHEEVRTYFHEFGHVMHHICSKTRYSIFHGTSVERDFVEVPSQVFENLCWEKESLKKISCHYITRKPLSDGLINKLVQSRKANMSIFYAKQICLSMFDHVIHTTQKECMNFYTRIEPTPGTNFAASFVHIFGGYDAHYYSYLWSLVYSLDIFYSKFKNEGIMSSAPGLRFRNLILLPGGTKDGSEMVTEFLGRGVVFDPFMETAGLIENEDDDFY